jgi:HK97 family phage prohead protease
MSARLSAPEVKLLALPPRSVTVDGTFSGYASLFGIADLGRDMVMPGAFVASLARRGPSGIRMLWQHDPAEPVGRWLAIAEDARGLHVRGQLNLAVRRARELAALIADGAVDGLSIGFRTEKARPERGLRRLLEVDLWEISLVTFPMLPAARVDGKHAQPLPQERERCLALSIRRAAARLRRHPPNHHQPTRTR